MWKTSPVPNTSNHGRYEITSSKDASKPIDFHWLWFILTIFRSTESGIRLIYWYWFFNANQLRACYVFAVSMWNCSWICLTSCQPTLKNVISVCLSEDFKFPKCSFPPWQEQVSRKKTTTLNFGEVIKFLKSAKGIGYQQFLSNILPLISPYKSTLSRSQDFSEGSQEKSNTLLMTAIC